VEWEWAELDGKRLVWASEGKLFSARFDSCGSPVNMSFTISTNEI
jgi:hypothetical protein